MHVGQPPKSDSVTDAIFGIVIVVTVVILAVLTLNRLNAF